MIDMSGVLPFVLNNELIRPQNLSPNRFPAVSFTFVKYLPDVIGESFAICFTGFATSFAISKILADKHNYIVDPNQVNFVLDFIVLFYSVLVLSCLMFYEQFLSYV